MVEFLAALMALVATFAQGGQPDVLPPHNQAEASQRGSMISELVKQNKGPQESTESADLTDVNLEDEVENEVDTTKVSAYNYRSDKEMPTLLPQVALDNGKAFSESEEEDSEEVVEQENSDFGQEVSDSQPDSAKTDGQSFGQSTSEEARGNSRRD